MRLRSISIGALLCALLAGAAPALAGPRGPIGHAGRWITDASGRVLILHGTNMVYKLPPYYPEAIGFDDDDAAFLAGEGFDVVRVGVIYAAVEPRPGVYGDAYLDHIATTVKTLARHGIASILDFHQDLYNEAFQGEGWPAWAVRDDGLPNQPQTGFPGNYVAMPALQRAFDHFWSNDPGPDGIGLQDHYAAAWRHVAQRFRGNPSIVGYELLNEPWPGSTWQECANPVGCPVNDGRLAAFVRRTLGAIRQADPATLVWYEPYVLFNFGADTQIGSPGDGRTGFAFHDYCLVASEGSDPITGTPCGQFDDLVFANALKHVAATGDALLMTEFGATREQGVLRRMVERADRNLVPWAHWHYCACYDPTTSGPGDTQALVRDPRRPPAGDNLVTSTLDVVSRPHPEALAGTPLAIGFDSPARVFSARWSTARAGGGGAFPAYAESELLVPGRQYPGGYSVDARGAAVLSAPGALRLRVAACPGAGEVTVQVSPPGAGVTASCPGPVARPAGPRWRLAVSVLPRVVRAGDRRRFAFTVAEVAGRRRVALRGARIRFLGRTLTTRAFGRTVTVARVTRPGRYLATASVAGLSRARALVRVRPRPRPRPPRFAG
jgi:endoglycosylceramidase